MDAETLKAKLTNAEDAVELLIAYVRPQQLAVWLHYLEPMRTCLRTGDVEGAVRAREAVPRGGVHLVDHDAELARRWHNVSAAIGNVKVYTRYGADRPLVEL